MLLLLLCSVLGATVRSEITPEILDSYRSYSFGVLHDKYTRKVSDDIGASGYYTPGLGHLLAVINEKLWEIDTYGFDNALKIRRSAISKHYQHILQSLTEDPAVTLHSDIYTSNKHLRLPGAFNKLKTQSSFVDYNSTTVNINSAAAEINARIAVQTFGRIYGTLIPEGGWWGRPFFNYTQGILTNTFHFRTSLANALKGTIESKFLDGEKWTFLETTGIPLPTHSDSYKAVRIPFKGSTKSLVLILPASNVTTFVKNDLEAHLRKVYTDLRAQRTVRVLIPKMNLTLPTSYFRQLKKYGVTESMCRYDKGRKNVFESPVQNVHVFLDETMDLQLAAATGTHVNNVESYIAIHESQTEPHVQEDTEDEAEDNAENLDMLARMKSDLFDDGELTLKSRRLPNKAVIYRPQREESESESEEEVEKVPKPASSTRDKETIAFDRPFFFYLEDPSLGPIFFGSVESLEKYRKHEKDVPPKGFEWQEEALKYLFWSCP